MKLVCPHCGSDDDAQLNICDNHIFESCKSRLGRHDEKQIWECCECGGIYAVFLDISAIEKLVYE